MGNTKIVDMGYVDATYMMLMNGSTRTYDLPTQEAYMLDMRQRFVDAGLNDGVNWSLSPIGFSIGSGDTARGRGQYVFVIQHLTAGDFSGKEWLICLPAAGNSNLSTMHHTIGSSVANAQTHFLANGAATGTGSVEGCFVFDYNPFGLTKAYGMSGVSDDFDAVDIKSGLDTFMPTVGAKQLGIMSPLTVTNENNLALVFNHAVPFVGIYQSDLNTFARCHVAGDIIETKRGPGIDDYVNGVFYCASTNVAATRLCLTQTDDGTPIQTALTLHGLFLAGNQPYFDGADYVFHRDKPLLSTASYIKGYLRPDIIPIQGGVGRHYLRPFKSEHGVSIKIENALCAPWSDTDPVPFSGWPLNPQLPTFGP
jgi:hypothetical protein